jgi:hypothetical protein
MWPRQSECDAFYGNPRGVHNGEVSAHWYAANIVYVTPPFAVTYEGTRVKRIAMHQKCAGSFARVLDKYSARFDPRHERYGDGTLPYGGSFCYRLIRGGNTLSMHAYGCAIDFDVEHNPMGRLSPGGFHANSPLVLAFKEEGWTWGGDFVSRPDPMHFQAARV